MADTQSKHSGADAHTLVKPVRCTTDDPEINEAIERALSKLPPPCDHAFGGWREFEDGRGGEQFCQHCGLGAMAWSMRNLP